LGQFVELVSLGNHLLSSSGDGERQEFPCAPFRYGASIEAILSNNFLEVDDNFLDLRLSLVASSRGPSAGSLRSGASKSSFLLKIETKTKISRQYAVNLPRRKQDAILTTIDHFLKSAVG
jgi:hypothetical protein